MDYRKKLNKMELPDLEEIAQKLKVQENLIKIPGSGELTREAELIKKILKCPKKEIKKALGMGWWKKYHNHVYGIVTIIACLSTYIIFFHSKGEIKKNKIELEKIWSAIEKKIDDPAAERKVKEEYEKKLADMEETLKNLKTGDKKARDEALKAFREGDYSKARKLFEGIRKKEKENQKKYALTAYNQGEIAFLELDFNGALAHYLEAEQLDPDNTLYQNEVGKSYYTLGKYKKAKNYFEKALTNDLKANGSEHPTVARDRSNLGSALFSMGQYEKAIYCFEKSLASDLKTYGSKHPIIAIRWSNLGETWRKLGKYEKAIPYFEKALLSGIETFGKRHPKVALRWSNLGGVHYYQRQYQKAIECYKKALSIDLETNGPEHPFTARDWSNLGTALQASSQYEKAKEYHEKALSSDMKTYGSEHPKVALKWNNLGGAWDLLGNYEKAMECYEKALKIFEPSLGKDHPNTKVVKNNLEYTRKKIK
jgi:tetratricopeptide (TPR) repeat protein